MKQLIVFAMVFLLIGCEDKQDLPTRTETTVNVQSYLMDAAAFDMQAVVSRLKEGDLKDARALQDFINETPGINNVDLDHDSKVDEIIVKEEKSKDGSLVMAVTANPSSGSGEPTVIAELGFEKNTSTGQVEVTGSYPHYVNGHSEHYYRHTLTGSTIGDMMFYSWLFSPRPVYAPVYRPGLYYGASRPVMSSSQVQSTRTTYRTKNSVSPVKKATKPASYTPKSTAAKKTASKYPSNKTSGSLSSKTGKASSFKKSTASSTQKASGFKSTKPSTTSKPKSYPKPAPRPVSRPKSSWGSSSRSSWGSSSRRKSLAKFKHDINYISDDERKAVAMMFFQTSLATWEYNGEEGQSFGVIIDDLDSSNLIVTPSGEEIDLYSYTSVIGAAAQQNQIELQELREEVQRLRQGICQ